MCTWQKRYLAIHHFFFLNFFHFNTEIKSAQSIFVFFPKSKKMHSLNLLNRNISDSSK